MPPPERRPSTVSHTLSAQGRQGGVRRLRARAPSSPPRRGCSGEQELDTRGEVGEAAAKRGARRCRLRMPFCTPVVSATRSPAFGRHCGSIANSVTTSSPHA
jgi:hypothetical protein